MVAIAAACSVGLIAGCSSSTKGKPDGSGSPAGSQSNSSASSPASNPGSNSSVPAGGHTLSKDEREKLEHDVADAMRATTGFHMTGAGKDDDGTAIQFDIHFGPDKKVDGTIVQHGQTTKVINSGDGSIYFQAPDEVWKQEGGDAAVAVFHGKWAKAPADDKRFSNLTDTFNKDGFIDELTSSDDNSDDLRQVGPATVDGTAATQYASASDKSVIFIAASGPPLLLKGGTLPDGLLAFTDYNKDYPYNPPPAAQTVDISKLGH
jgi:hypothetical protein